MNDEDPPRGAGNEGRDPIDDSTAGRDSQRRGRIRPRARTETGERRADTGVPSDRVYIAGVEAAVAAGIAAPEEPRDEEEFARFDPEPPRTMPAPPDELLDWTEPPTGQVPRVLMDAYRDDPAADTGTSGVRGPVWREQGTDWDDEADLSDLSSEHEAGIPASGGSIDDEDPFDFDFGTGATRAVQDGASDLDETDSWTDEDGAADAVEPVYGPSVPTESAVEAEREIAWQSWTGGSRAQADPSGDLAPAAGESRLSGRLHASRRAGTRSAAETEGMAPPSRVRRRGGATATATAAPANEGPDDIVAGNAPSGRNIGVAILTGLGIGFVAIICFVLGSVATLALSTLVVTAGCAECFAGMRRAGYRPATLVGLVAVPMMVICAYLAGATGSEVVLAVFTIVTMLWFLAGVSREDPVSNIGATFVGLAWVGLLGSFAGLLLAPSMFPRGNGVALLIGAIVPTVGYDVAAFAVGAFFGKHKLAPTISPNKTWEGLAGGVVMALLLSGAVVSRIHPWHVSSALAVGLVVAVVAPIGDLCESMFKRSLGLKDMGSLLPEHGGVLDRVDALLFVLPAVYLFVRVAHIA